MGDLRPGLAALLSMALFPPERSGPFVIELPEHMKPRRKPDPPPRQSDFHANLERERLEKEATIQAIRDERVRRKKENWKKQHPHEQ